MSTTIDNKVVEMRFDNRHFEANAKQSMSTLEKLKEKLNLSGASKGLENLNTSANKVNMNGLSSALDTVHSKFSALSVMGITALANITNSAVNAGKRMVHALTIAPVKDGFNEYEMMLNAIQTTMAATEKTAEEVEEQLKSLDKYADKTVYSTADMLNNLPKFTNAGVKLEDATTAMIGIANATALAGGDASKASIAFYNLGQAIGTGYLTRMDYNSINNAGIATMEWKKQMVEAAIAAGTLKKVGADSYKAGNKTLTLQQLFIDGLQEQWATTEVMMKVFKDYGDETTEIGKKSYSAAQDIKTFSMMMDSLKATAGTGWKDTWQIIFGDLDGAKKLWTGLNDFISNIIKGMAKFRNDILESALGKSFKGIVDKVKEPIKAIEKTVKSVEDHVKVVDEIINGKWGNGQKRWDALTKAGYDWKHAQNLVNEELGVSKRRATDYIEKQKELGTVQGKTNETTTDQIINLLKLSDAELKAKKYTDDQIKAFRELEKVSKQTGIPLKEFIENINEIDGKWLLLNSFKNIGQALVKVFGAMRDAWVDIFPTSRIANGLFNIIAGFHKLTTNLKISDETADKLKRTFKGLFAAIDLISMVLGGAVKMTLTIAEAILKEFNMDILDFTALVGDAISKLRDWVKEHNYLGIAIGAVTKFIVKIVTAVKDWITSNETIMNGISKFKEEMLGMGDGISNWIKGLKEAENIPLYIIQGLINGLKNGAGTVIELIIALGKGLLEGICQVLGINSPSKEFEKVGKFSVEGLINGFKELAPKLFEVIKAIGSKLLSLFKEIDIGDIILAGGVFGVIKILTGAVGIIDRITKPFEGINAILENAAGVVASAKTLLDNLGGMFKDFGKAQKMKAMASVLKSIALVIAILAASVFVLSKIEPGKLWGAIGAVAALVVLAGGLYALVQVLGSGKKGFKSSLQSIILLGSITRAIFKLALSTVVLAIIPIGKMWSAVGAIAVLSIIAAGLYTLVQKLDAKPSSISSSIKSIFALSSIANALFIMALAVRILATASPLQLVTAILGFTYMVGAMGALLVAFSTMVKDPKTAANMTLVSGMLLKMSAALLILAIVTKLVGGMSVSDMVKGGAFMLAFVAFVKLIVHAASVGSDKKVYKIGGMLIAISTAMLIMVAVIKLVSLLKVGELVKGAAFMLGFIGFVKLLVSVLTVGNDATIAKVGATILAISVAMLLLTAVMKIIGGMDIRALIKGAIGVTYLSFIMAALIGVVESSKDAPKIAGVLLAMSGAIGILALATKLLSTISVGGLVKGLSAVAVLSLIMTSMMQAAKEIKGGIGSLIVMTVAIGVMAIAVAALSKIPFKKLAGATVALGSLMGIFAIMVKATETAKKAMGTLIVLTVVVTVLGGVLFGLSKLPVEQTLGAASALSILLGTITGVSILLSKMGGINAKALLGVAGLVTICGMLYIVVDVLRRMDGIENAASNATVLGAFMGVLSIIQLVCAAVGAIYAATGGIAMLGLVGMLALLLEMYIVVDILKKMQNVENAMVNLNALSAFMVLMTKILVVLGIIGPLALVGVAAMSALTILMIGIGAFALAVGAIMEKFPALQSFLDTGLPVLVQLAGGIGQMIGAFVGGAISQISNNLPNIGTNLSEFMNKAMIFIDGARKVDERVLTGVTTLAKALLALTAASLIAGVSSFLPFGSSFAELGTQLSQFMINALPFITTAMMIPPNVIDTVKLLADAILIITAANLIEGITRFLGGGSSLEKFGSELQYLGSGIKDFITAIGPVTTDQVDAAKNAAEVIKTLAQAAKQIPNTGGVLATLVGENDMSTWAQQLPILAKGIVDFTNVILESKLESKAVETAKIAAEVIKTLATAAKEIPNTGGLLADLIGDNDLQTFAEGLPTVGKGIVGFIKTLTDGEITQESANVAKTAAGVIKTLAKVAQDIPNTGGVLAALVGDNDLSDFAKKLPDIGKGIANFAKELGEFGPEKIDTVNSAVKAINAIAKLGKIDLKDTGKGLTSFGDNMVKFAKKVKSFVEHLGEVGAKSIDSSIKKTKDLIKMAQTVADTNVESLKTFGDSLKKFAKNGVKGFVKEFNGSTPKADAKKAGKQLVQSVIDGMNGQKDKIKEKGKSLGKAAADAMYTKDIEKSAKQAGKDLAIGFANGIKSKTSIEKVSAAGTTIGKAALKAAKKAIDSNSPSKEAMKIGNYFGQGLVIGIEEYEAKSYDAGYGIADYARNGLSKAISKVSNIISSGIDAQPTIRPVLDLSDVESGAGYLNTMFNDGPSIGVMSNLRAISSGMNARSQNGPNGEVVSAINKLRKDLGNVSGTTNNYNVNGITYDDGSNITDAVRTLVRAAKVERRV